LARDEKSAVRFDVLERGNPLFDGVTTGVVVGKSLYFMANIQDGRTTDFRPISVLALRL
jgi:hypothetical protein